jgi:hypothetical protein
MKYLYLITLSAIAAIGIAAVSTNSNINRQYAYSWLEGSWTGDGFGGFSEEVWSAPSADGKMMGVYRHHKGDGSLNFYEFIILDESGIKLKHFTPGFKSWEEKEDFVHFEMIEYDENMIKMKGLVFKKIDDEHMEIHLSLKENDEYFTEIFHMKRKN